MFGSQIGLNNVGISREFGDLSYDNWLERVGLDCIEILLGTSWELVFLSFHTTPPRIFRCLFVLFGRVDALESMKV